MEINLDKIKGFTAITIIFVLCGTIIPSFLFLYIYKPNLFFSLDFYRLSLIATSISSPLLIINTTLCILRLRSDKNETENHNSKFHEAYVTAIYLGSILTTSILCTSIIIGFYFSRNIKDGVFALLVGEILSVINYYLVVKYSKNKK